ncbi:MAG TPA: cell envelope integrity protein CreD [Telluria sp.]|nr:cell envelope integrity protein CreD [Telluria sp.]
MQRALFFKIAIIFAVMAGIGIALAMVQGTVSERAAFHDQAVQSIAADSVGAQAVAGPVLVLPYVEEYDERIDTDTPAGKKSSVEHRSVERRQFVFPDLLKAAGTLDTDQRYRGLHRVLVFSGAYGFRGEFVLPGTAAIAPRHADGRIRLGRPFVALSIGDVRGIRNAPSLSFGGRTVNFEQGSGLASLTAGVHANLELADVREARRVGFAFDLNLDGIEQQSFAPIARANEFRLRSNWPHPQFAGRFLPAPRDRRIGPDGFVATWLVSSLATAAQRDFVAAENAAPKDGVHPSSLESFSVGFIEPVNIYTLADRATKYGVMFVALTFAAFFVFEILKRLPIHPVQYALVGLALTLFFLLLLSLSEHVRFGNSYVAAAGACIALITYYLRFVLGGWWRALGFGAALATLYGALYGLLISENNALVLGSLLLFAVLAAIMVATRKIDWYRLGKDSE